jgi:hypothetical protein
MVPNGRAVASIALGLVVAGIGQGCALVQPIADGPSCKKQPVHAELHILPGAKRDVWGTDMDTGREVLVQPRSDVRWRVDVHWPPSLVDDAGRVLATDGAIFWEACIDPVTGTYYLAPEDLPGPGGPT